MPEHRRTGSDGKPFIIGGDLIGRADSKKGRDGAERLRWSEVEVFRLESGRYAAWVVGRSNAPGESDDFCRLHEADDPAGLIRSLWLRKFNGLHFVALEALERAADVDDAVDLALEAYEQEAVTVR